MLRFCNSHATGIWTAISFFSPDTCGGEGGEWQNIGWFRVEAGQCTIVHGADVNDVGQFWYYYAEADDGARWEGEYPTFVHPVDAFDICDGIGSTTLQRVGFRELDVENYTLTFVT